MTENKGFYRQTFSQREGKIPLPEPMRLEHVSEDFRHLVWLAVDNSIKREETSLDRYMGNTPMRNTVLDYTVRVLHWPHDNITHRPSIHRKHLRKIILQQKL